MSAWTDARALAYEAPADKLRDHYESACFALALVWRALGNEDTLSWTPEADPSSLADDVRALRVERDSMEEERDTAEGRLEEKLQVSSDEEDDVTRLRKEIEDLRRENEDLHARLEKVKPLLDAYADCLAVSRRFIAAAEEAKLPVRHCRIVSKTRRAKGAR